MFYEDFQLTLLEFLKPHWKRVIFLDLETHVIDDNFLSNERILSISYARRVSDNFLDSEGIEVTTLILDHDDDESEISLLNKLNDEIGKIRPLGVIGYGIRFYDIPLLTLKKERHPIKLWKVIDMLESACHVDLYHILKQKGYRKLYEAINSNEFKELPLLRNKNIVPRSGEEKAKEIYRLWKEDRNNLEKYNKGDVHDTLLIAENFLSS